jgi:large subunit ribosomal protein L17
MVTSLFKYDRIHTTDVKAKELRRWADNLITLAKQGDLHSRRRALAVIRERDVVHKLFETANERFGKINGGYTRVVKLGRRPGDSAPVSIVELLALDKDKKKKEKSEETKKKQKDVKPAADIKDVKKEDKPEEKAEAVHEAGEKAETVEAKEQEPELADQPEEKTEDKNI